LLGSTGEFAAARPWFERAVEGGEKGGVQAPDRIPRALATKHARRAIA